MNSDIGIYLVTDTAQCGERSVVETVRQAVARGVHTVQVRDKQVSANDLLEMLESVAGAVGQQATVLINDRVDVYLAAWARGAGVHGVHVGQDDLPAAEVRHMVGPDAIVGLTANTQAHFEAAASLPAGTVDYFGVGAIHATQTKPDHPDALGIDGFARLARSTTMPCVAIGGVNAGDVAGLREAGAAGAAVVSAVCAADDAAAAAEALTHAWHGE